MKGVPHGLGRYTYSNGDIFSGYFDDGKANGYGELCTQEGSKYFGDWLDDL